MRPGREAGERAGIAVDAANQSIDKTDRLRGMP